MKVSSLIQKIPTHRVSGLRPDVWVCVGSGYVREDIKDVLLSQGQGFISPAIQSLDELCCRILKIQKDRILPSSMRQEAVRMLLSEPRILSQVPEMKRIKRQRDFIRRLEQAIQSGRLAFAHSFEEEVYEDRLNSALGENLLRQEVRGFSRAFEAWLTATGWYDHPRLLQEATEVLRTQWPEGVEIPNEIWILSAEFLESLEKEFWETLSHYVKIQRISPLDNLKPDTNSKNSDDIEVHEQNLTFSIQSDWQRWHTLDDAAEGLADYFINNVPSNDWSRHAVVIPDLPAVRRSLKRAFERHHLPFSDPRDPTRLRWEEAVKMALLPIDVVARNFERHKVISWLRCYQMQWEFPTWVKEINARGIRSGIVAYSGGVLAGVFSRLNELNGKFGGRLTCEDLAEKHLVILREHLAKDNSLAWLITFFEQLWDSFKSDISKIGHSEKKAPLLYWYERLQVRLAEASPPVPKLKPEIGIQLYRLQQSPVKNVEKVWFFGLPGEWLRGEGQGGYWYNERDRDLLASEFAVRSAKQVHDERLAILKAWLAETREVSFLDAEYDYNGRERTSIFPILVELEAALETTLSKESVYQGAHPRYSKSYGVIRPVQSQVIDLPAVSKTHRDGVLTLTATTLERYSRCSFQSLIFNRWKLRDLREPDSDLWPDIRGNILHEAVRILLNSFNADGQFLIKPQTALDQAWKLQRPQGLLRGNRIEKYVKKRLVKVLEVFCEKEADFFRKAGTKPISLDEHQFKVSFGEFDIIGKPDRVDAHPEGLFVIDYKTSGSVPHGVEILERGYRLQLPFYAIAAQEQFGKPAIGMLFVELDRKGGRKSGVLFSKYNGKGSGALTQLRSNSKSLIERDPEEVLQHFKQTLYQDAKNYLKGHFRALPRTEKREKECSRCVLADACGYRRLSELQGSQEAENAN